MTMAQIILYPLPCVRCCFGVMTESVTQITCLLSLCTVLAMKSHMVFPVHHESASSYFCSRSIAYLQGPKGWRGSRRATSSSMIGQERFLISMCGAYGLSLSPIICSRGPQDIGNAEQVHALVCRGPPDISCPCLWSKWTALDIPVEDEGTQCKLDGGLSILSVIEQ
jgi:hypothetical protein